MKKVCVLLVLLATLSGVVAQAPRPPVDKLSRLTDVNITNAADAQVLTYDNASSKWKNASNAGGVLTLTGDTTGTKVGSSVATTTSNMTAPASFTLSDSGTNAVHTLATYKYDSTGTPGIGFGMKNIFELETTTTNDQIAAVQIYQWSTAANATRTSQYTLQLVNNAVAGNVLVISGNGNAVFTGAVTGSNLSGTNTGDQTLTSLGGTTVGQSFFTLTNPTAITFPRINADNTVSALNAASFRTAIGAGTGGGDALTTNPLSQFASTTSSQFKGVISDENAPDGASSKVIMALGSLSIASGKTATFSNTLTFAGTDSSTLNIGAGGTLGSNAYTSTAYVPTSTTVNGHALSSNVTVTPTDLSLVIGTNTEAWDADLDTWATLTPSANFQTMVPHTFAQMRTDLGLVIGTNVEAWDADLDTWAGVTPGTGVATALAVNVGTDGAFVVKGGAGGTPSSINLANATFPTLNQNTTGSAASLSISGQTGLLTFIGLASTNRAKTVRDAADTILELGGSYTPTGTWNWATATVTWPTFNQNTTGSAAKLTTARTIGGTSFDGSANIVPGTSTNLVGGNGTTLLGTVPYQSATDTTSFVNNTTTTKKFLTETGDGTNGAAPSFGTIATGDVPTLNQNTTGSAASLTTSRNIGGVAFNGTANIVPTNISGGNGTTLLGSIPYQSNTDTTTQLAPNVTTTKKFLRETGDGTNGTAPAWDTLVAGDVPTLNQNTTGSAATLTTARAIYGNNFDGSVALTQIIASTYGGTGNGFTKFSGPTTSEKTKTVRDATDTILELGGSYTPTGTWTNMVLATPNVGTPSAETGTNLSGTGASFTAGNATKWTTGRTIATTGDVTYTSGSLDGSGNVTGTATVANVPSAATHATDNTTIPTDTGGWTEYFITNPDYTTTTTTAGTDITGLTSGTLTGGAVYEFQVVLRLLNAADATGMKVAIHGGGTGSAATVFSNWQANTSSATAAANQAINAIDTLGSACVSYSSGEGIVVGTGFFTARTTGTPTMSVQLAKVTSNTATARIGSVLRIRKAHT